MSLTRTLYFFCLRYKYIDFSIQFWASFLFSVCLRSQVLPKAWLSHNQIKKVIFFREHLHRVAVYERWEHCAIKLLQSKTTALATEMLSPQKLWKTNISLGQRGWARVHSVLSVLLDAVGSSGRSQIKRKYRPSRAPLYRARTRSSQKWLFLLRENGLGWRIQAHKSDKRRFKNFCEDHPASRSLI